MEETMMEVLLGLCIVMGIIIALQMDDILIVLGVAFAIIFISIMIYICYKKLQSIEDKIDEMNEGNNSENNNEAE